jgi:hypothetical protein
LEKMLESLTKAKDELKRVDHLIYVSLKYTRTVDVLKNVIDRLVNAFDFMILSLLRKAKDNKKIDKIPTAPVEMCDVAKELYSSDKTILDIIDFYLLLRKITKAEYESENEYRRHVTMKAGIDGKTVNVDIDEVTEYYKRAKDFIIYIEEKYK